MSGESIVQVEGVSKKFCRRLRHSLVYGMHDFAREITGRSHQGNILRPNEFWALRDVSFSILRGDPARPRRATPGRGSHRWRPGVSGKVHASYGSVSASE